MWMGVGGQLFNALNCKSSDKFPACVKAGKGTFPVFVQCTVCIKIVAHINFPMSPLGTVKKTNKKTRPNSHVVRKDRDKSTY